MQTTCSGCAGSPFAYSCCVNKQVQDHFFKISFMNILMIYKKYGNIHSEWHHTIIQGNIHTLTSMKDSVRSKIST